MEKTWNLFGRTIAITTEEIDNFKLSTDPTIKYIEVEYPPTMLLPGKSYYYDPDAIDKLDLENLDTKVHGTIKYFVPEKNIPGPLIIEIEGLPFRFIISHRIRMADDGLSGVVKD